MTDPFVSIILRSYNEGWALRETLPALRAQDYKNWELIVIDSGSTDGSPELIRQANPAHFIQIRHEDYNPSRVMNHGMQLARSDFGIFLNADATPQDSNWLRPLVMALQDPQVAAVFGRQIPRPDCRAVYAHDYERCFGPNRESTQWEHFFSMVSSGLRKDIWSRRGFLEKMQYSEDDEYTRWCRAEGYRIVYVPESLVMHSHNYTLQQAYKRSFGEAKALAAVWNGEPEQINFPKTVLLGWTNDARRDFLFCSREKCLQEFPHAARIRWQQRRAKLAGFREGWSFYRNGSATTHNHTKSQAPLTSPNIGATSPSPIGGDLSRSGSGERNVGEATSPRGPSERERASHGAGVTVPSNGNGPSSHRFTLDGSDELENRLTHLCEKVLSGVKKLIPEDKLEALVLGGGYGRGQGGVLETEAGDAPYNDLEFYVFLRGNRVLNERDYSQKLNGLGEELSAEAGLHVEFKVDSVARLRRGPVTMFSYDLVSGHRVLFGGQKVFAGCERHLDAANIPLAEATRLLFNRCTGLLLAKELLKKPALNTEDTDFIGRNIAKAQLAIGDAMLAAYGKYDWDCRKRGEAVNKLAAAEALAWMRDAQNHHAAGVQFKLHPQRVSMAGAAFRSEHETISNLTRQTWLWLENLRLGCEFHSVHDYSMSRIAKCSGSPAWRNVLLNARTFGTSSVFEAAALRYPRERLFNSLPLLLWDEPLNDLRVKYHLQKQLRTTATDWQGFVTAYKAVWPKFS